MPRELKRVRTPAATSARPARARSVLAGLVAAAALACGCRGVTPANFEAIRPGISTRADVRALFGTPGDPEGAPVWTYFDLEGARVEIEFDSTGVVTRKHWRPPASDRRTDDGSRARSGGAFKPARRVVSGGGGDPPSVFLSCLPVKDGRAC